MNKTPFEADLDTLDLTFAQVQLIKQMVSGHIIGEDEGLQDLPFGDPHPELSRDKYRKIQRERLGQL